ncbi:MAG TPA: ankyrin repeat domain-containing protein [Chryseosolibacter sp.]|nr:ankyrin repeat domain-containing protein [Chryseosolibacter sp.]
MASDPQSFCDACMAGEVTRVADMLHSDPLLMRSHGAVRADHREFMKTQGADGGWTPLHLACHYGQSAIVRLLIDSGADVNTIAANAIGNTPLMAAIAGRNAEIIKLLIDTGADPKIKDKNGYDAFAAAKASGDQTIIDMVK